MTEFFKRRTALVKRTIDGFRNEDGGITVLNVFLVVVIALLGGVAIDMANLITARTQLQIAADVAAHAAIYTRDSEDKDDAKAKAVELALQNMPDSVYGEILTVDDIHFGTWDKASQTFTINDDLRGAVYVKTDRLSEKANAVTAFLLQFAGFNNFDVVTTSVFETYRPSCLREGFVAEERVDMQSNNGFYNGFCIHSNSHVEVNNNNFFEPGTIVSMPNVEDLVLPSSGFEKNEGLEAALREGEMNIRILDRIVDIENGMTDPDSRYYRDWVTQPEVITLEAGSKLNASELTSGRVHEVKCGGSGTLTFQAELFTDAVVMTDCEVKFQGSELHDFTVISRATSDDAISASSNPIFGRDDDCADGGGAQIVTYGGYKSAAKLSMFGSQLLAAGDVNFAAQASGIKGASIIAGGEIDGTSLAQMGFCGSGMTDNFEAEYFRMAG